MPGASSVSVDATADGGAYRITPSLIQALALANFHGRLEAPIDLPQLADLFAALPETHSQPRQVCGPQRGGLGDLRSQRSEEHPSELESLMRNSYSVFRMTKNN